MNRLNISLLPLVIALTCASPAQAEERADNARMQIAANAEAAAAQPRKEAMQARKEAEPKRALTCAKFAKPFANRLKTPINTAP
jgi:hypothetical protein